MNCQQNLLTVGNLYTYITEMSKIPICYGPCIRDEVLVNTIYLRHNYLLSVCYCCLDLKELVALYLLPALLTPPMVRCTQDGKRKCPSITKMMQAFIITVMVCIIPS